MPNTVDGKANAGRSRLAADARYADLLKEFSPVAIESAAENRRALLAVDALMNKPGRDAAETAMLKLLAVLIENFEQRHYSMGAANPLEVLKELMRAREMRPKDLWGVFGSKGIASEVLNGKRGISREMAKKLAVEFHVSPAAFV